MTNCATFRYVGLVEKLEIRTHQTMKATNLIICGMIGVSTHIRHITSPCNTPFYIMALDLAVSKQLRWFSVIKGKCLLLHPVPAEI